MTDARHDLGLDIPAAPENLTSEEYEACASALAYNVEHGVDPLNDLSDATHKDLARLAFNDLLRLGVLENTIRDKLRGRNEGHAKAKQFNLNLYRNSARQTQKQISEHNTRAAKMRQRNMKIVSGGKDAKEGTAVDLPDASFTIRAMAESSAYFLRAAALLLELRGGRLWYDDFHGDYFTDWDGKDGDQTVPVRKIDDAWLLRCHGWLLMLDTKLGNLGTNTTEKVIHYVADQDHRNAPKSWLTELRWDEEERLAVFLSRAYGAAQDAYHAAVGRCWFVSMAARVCDPGCKVDTMPVLFGPQGTAKSTSLEVIGGEWYATINTTADNKDFLDALRGLLVAEVAELDAISGNRVENSRVKTLLSTRVDRYRPPYGRTSRDFRRTAVLVGTTNDAGWHRDETGGRRFWPIHCAGLINLEWLRANREQLFAEACARHKRGESWWDVPGDEQEARVMEHYTNDPWEDRIAQAIAAWGATVHRGGSSGGAKAKLGDPSANEESAHWGTLVTTNRLAAQALNLPTERQSRVTSNRIARAMRQLGWVSRAVRVKSNDSVNVVKVWVVTQKAGDKEDEQRRLDV